MMNWNRRNDQKQLDHYSPKRQFRHVVDLGTGIDAHRRTGKSTMIGITMFFWDMPSDIKSWLNENVGEEYYKVIRHGVVAFNRDTDAMAFKLRWA